MKYDCKLIEDLLPLYKDGICSEASIKAVQEHLKECPQCTKMLNELNDTEIDDMIIQEKENVIGTQSKFFKRKSALVGSIIAAVFAVPILVCLIVNLAVGHGLTWFFIVLAAMFIPTSLFVVPLMAPKNRMFLTMTSFTASVILLLGVCCLFTGGSWFMIAATATLFGLTICFMPFIACRRPVNAYLKNKKGLAIMGAYTVTFYLMILCIGLTVKSATFFPMALTISLPIIAMTWLIFFVIRYLPVNGFLKAGISIAAISSFVQFGTPAIVYLCVKNVGDDVVYYSDTNPIVYMACIGLGILFAVIGILVGLKKEKNND